MKSIIVNVPDNYCMEPGGNQCRFLYHTGKKFRCRAFFKPGEWLHRDDDCKTHKCKQCIESEVDTHEPTEGR